MRTVVFRTGSLGDTVCAVPAFRALRRQFERDELVLLYDAPRLGRVSAADVLKGLALFDRVVGYCGGNGIRSWIDLALRVRELRPDRLVLLPQRMDRAQNLAWKRVFFRLLGVAEVRGIRGPEYGAGLTEARRLLALLESEGLYSEHLGYSFPVDAAVADRVRDWMEGRRKGRSVVVVCGGGKTATQRWGWERYREVLLELVERYGVFVVGVGTSEERKEAQGKVLGLVPGMEWIPEDWGISELPELMRGAELYVGNDTGPMHVAAALGCPVFVVMSARNPVGVWDPDVEPRCVVRLKMDCEGCFLAECRFPGQPCLDGIGVERAKREITEFLETHRILGGTVRRGRIWGVDCEGRGGR